MPIKIKADIIWILIDNGKATTAVISGLKKIRDLRYGVKMAGNHADPHRAKYATHKPEITCVNNII